MNRTKNQVKIDPNKYAQDLGVLSSKIIQVIPNGISESREQLFDKVDGSILIALNLIEILQRAIRTQEDIMALDPKAPDYRASIVGLLSNSPSRELLSQHVDVAFSNAIELRKIMDQLVEEKTKKSEIPPSVGRTIQESENVKRQREDLEKRLAEYLSEEKPPPKLTQTEMDLARASQQEIKDLLRLRVDKLNKLIKKAINLVNLLRGINKKQMEHFGAKDEDELRYILEHGGKPGGMDSKPESGTELRPKVAVSNDDLNATGTTVPSSTPTQVFMLSNEYTSKHRDGSASSKAPAGSVPVAPASGEEGKPGEGGEQSVNPSNEEPKDLNIGEEGKPSGTPLEGGEQLVNPSNVEPNELINGQEDQANVTPDGAGEQSGNASSEKQPNENLSGQEGQPSDAPIEGKEPSGNSSSEEQPNDHLTEEGKKPNEMAGQPDDNETMGNTLSTSIIEILPAQDVDTDGEIDSSKDSTSIPPPDQAGLKQPEATDAAATSNEPQSEPKAPESQAPGPETITLENKTPAPETKPPPSTSENKAPVPETKAGVISTPQENAVLPRQTSSVFLDVADEPGQFDLFCMLINGEISVKDAPVQAAVLTSVALLGVVLGYGLVKGFGKSEGSGAHSTTGGDRLVKLDKCLIPK